MWFVWKASYAGVILQFIMWALRRGAAMCKQTLREERGRRSAAGGSVQEEVIGGAWQEGYGRRIWAGIWMIIFIATRGNHGSNKV